MMLYIHVPFCAQKCPYCDFFSGQYSKNRTEAYLDAVCRNLETMPQGLDVDTIYFGGGTPSVLPLETVGRIVGALGGAGYEEFTFEVNPDDIVERGAGYVRGLLELGVNRISMGVQSFDDGILKWMNRRHDAAGARRAFAILREAGVANVSIDLIFGLPQLEDSVWEATVDSALELGADLIIQMDCDFSHDPNDIPRLIKAITSPLSTSTSSLPSLIIGSRYVPGGATPGWPFKRRLISRLGGIFIRTVTGMPLRDPTGGFKCWRAETLGKIDFATVASAGYSFQLEMNHRAWKAGCAIKEIPITFTDRVAGYSKITPGIATESIKIALKLRFGK